MESQMLVIIVSLATPVIALLFWWDFRTSGCAYGGSNRGVDNWLLTSLKFHIQRVRKTWAGREPRDVSDI